MYNWEISNFLSKNNYQISYSDYINIQMSSPQINHVKFNPYSNYFQIWTKDGTTFEFTCVKYKNI